MRPDTVLAAFVAICRSNIRAPCLSFSAFASPFKRVPLKIPYLIVDSFLDILAGLFHRVREDGRCFRLPAVVPASTCTYQSRSHDLKFQKADSPKLRSLLPIFISVHAIRSPRIEACPVRALNDPIEQPPLILLPARRRIYHGVKQPARKLRG